MAGAAASKSFNRRRLTLLTVHKQPLKVADVQTVTMPARARILTVQVQGGTPCIWYLCNPDRPPEDRTIRIAGTGHPIEEMIAAYISTFQLDGGALVFHAFEL